MEFPRLVYKSASLHCLVNDEEEFDSMILDGWFESVPEALKIKESPKPAIKEPEAHKAEVPKTIETKTLSLKGSK